MARAARTHLLSLSLPLSLCLLPVGACHTPSSKIPIDELEGADSGGTEPGGEARERLEPLPVEAPADLMPAEVAALAEALEPAAVLSLFTKLDKYPEFQQVRSEIRSEIGVDLFDAGQWQNVGLDAHGPAGIGLLDVEAQGFFLYVSVTDQGTFEGFVERMAAKAHFEDMSSVDIDDGRVYRMNDELSVVIRAGVAMMVLVDRPERALRDYATTVAAIDPREALSHTDAFTWAKQQIVSADDGLIFVAPNELLAQFDRGDDDRHDYGLRALQDELDQARAGGESQDYIRELELRLEEERSWQREREERDNAQRSLVHELFGPIGAVIAAADLRDDAIEGHARMLIPGDGLLKQLFIPIDVESPLVRAVDEAPMMALDGRVSLPALVAIAEIFARADGTTLAQVNAEIRNELGVDVLGELIPGLTGTGGIMVTEHSAPDPSKLSQVHKSLGLAAYAELANPEIFRRVLSLLVTTKRIPGLKRARRGDGWEVDVPDWHPLHIEVVGTRLIISTDKSLAGRIRDARPGAAAEVLAGPDHPFRGPVPAPSVRIYQRWLWAMIVDAHEPWEQDAESLLYDINSHGILNPEEAAAVPRSREFKRKFKELQAVVDELNQYQRRQAVRDFEGMLEFGRSLGDAGIQIESLADGVGAHMLWRMAPQTTPFDLLFQLLNPSNSNDWVEYERIMQGTYQLRDELQQIRQADLDAAAAKRTPK